MIIALLLVVGIIYLVFFFLKRGFGKRIVENAQIKILGSKIISGSKAVHLIEVGGLIYLIGSANESINLIAEITDKEARDIIKLETAQINEHRPKRFVEILSSFFRPKVAKQLEINESVDFIKAQRERLNKLNKE